MRPNSPAAHAALYRRLGLAVAKIRPGRKLPGYAGWQTRSLEARDFREGDSVAVLTGRLSGDLVCVDLDSQQSLSLADRLLPPTAMESGRPGKPRSHRYYRVRRLTAECMAGPHVAGGLGGPRIRHFAPAGIDLIGTGGQCVEPPSLHHSGERRAWDRLGEPALLPAAELYGAVEALARACGWRAATLGPPAADQAGWLDGLPPVERRVERARRYLARVPPAVSGSGGDRLTFYVACVLAVGFALPPEEAWPLLVEYSGRCLPPWSERELRHKLGCACRLGGPRGTKLLANRGRW